MQSQFERNAQRAAVEAVEARLAHNERVQKAASRRRAVSGLGAWIVGLVILAAIGLWFSRHSEGFGAFVGTAVDTVCGLFSGGDSAEARQGDIRSDRGNGENLSVKVSRPERNGAKGQGKDNRKAPKKRNAIPITSGI